MSVHMKLYAKVHLLHIRQYFLNIADHRLLEHLFLCEFYLPESFYCFSLNQRAIGVGAVQVNMAVFGAEQIQKSKITSRYFDKYMVAVNIGAIIALGCCLTFDGVIMFQSSLLSFNRPAVYAVMTAEGGFGLLVTLIIWVSGRMRD